MYQPTQQFIEQLNQFGRRFRARMTVGDNEITSIKTILLNTGSCGADVFSIGSVFASYVDIVTGTVDISLAGKEFLLEIGLVLSDDTIEYVPMGYFTVEKPSDVTKERDQTTIKAVDRITTKCAGLYVPVVTFPCTVQEVMDDIAGQAGITIVCNLDTSGTIETAMEGLLYRDVLGYIAGLLGGFCYADREGNIKIAAYAKEASTEIEKDRFMEIKPSETDYTVESLVVTVSEGGEDADGNEVEGVSYSEGSGTELALYNPYMTQELFDAMKDRLVGYSYCPGSVTFLGDPRLGPEDAIMAFNYLDNGFFFPCMSLTHEFDGGLTTTISTPGMTSSDESAKGPIQKTVERLQTEMVLAKDVIAKKITADYADLKYATIEKALILEAEIGKLDGEFTSFKYGEFEDLKADHAEFKETVTEELLAQNAIIENLKAEQITVDYLNTYYADVTLANIDIANINKGKIGELFAEVGLITKAVIEDGHVTGYLDAVSINANSIKAGTLSVERLVISGTEESIIYALNNAGELTSTSVDTLDGGLLTERTITADKLVAHSITATEITASDIIGANGWINLAEATFNYGNQLIWDGESLYIDASAITIVTDQLYMTSEEVIRSIDNIQIGGRNLIRNSKNLIYDKYYFDEGTPRLSGDILLDEDGNILLDEDDNMLVA